MYQYFIAADLYQSCVLYYDVCECMIRLRYTYIHVNICEDFAKINK